jgi:hypothetical protein
MSTQPPNFKGNSEWNRLSSSLGELAAVYGATFPLDEGATVRRITDSEVSNAATQVAQVADRYKKSLDSAMKKDKSVPSSDRQAALREVEQLKKDAQTLASRVKDGKPASGEAGQVLQAAQRIQEGVARPLTPEVQGAFQAIFKPLETIAQGFGLPAIKPKAT